MAGIIAGFFKDQSSIRHLKRASRLGFQCQEFGTDQVDDLSGDDWRRIFVIPHSLVHDPEMWPELRRRLTLANRFFVLVGQDLQTSDVVRAMKDGAFEVIQESDEDERWDQAFGSAAEAQKLWLQVYGGKSDSQDEILLGQSPEMVLLRQNIRRLGPTDATVLIMGESGAGKEKVAEALHHASGHRELVAVNCAAIPKDLIEAELFGSEKGAYTGAQTRKGLVEQADNGTLFLDEIGELDLGLQPKLLRFLETRVFRRVGGNRDFRVNLRVIAATNRELDREIAHGRFRGDLFFRLSEITLKIPPLRLRKMDIPIFAQMFMERANERFGKNFEILEPELIQKFQSYSWPGNVRELKSSLDRLVLMHFGTTLRAIWWDVPESYLTGYQPAGTMEMPHPQDSPWNHSPGFHSHSQPVTGGVHAISHRPHRPAHSQTSPNDGGRVPSQRERMNMARELLSHGDANLSAISAQLGIHPTTLYRWRKQGKV